MDKFNLQVKFEEIQDFQHPQFTKVKVWVATYGENANGSNITKEAFEKAMASIYNVPILGEYSESVEDFKGHGGKIEITDEGVKYIETTKPYGVIPESCNPRWEFDDEGAEYLVCDGLIWTGRYEEAKRVMENQNNQSMEINLIDYSIDKNVVTINDFTFTGICILGSEVQPCFPSAKVVYSLDKSEYKKEFALMLDEISKINFNKIGGCNLGREEILAKFSHLKGEEYENVVSNGELTLEELESKLFALSVNDLRTRIRETLSERTISVTDYWGDTYEKQEYYLEDLMINEGIIICEGSEWYKYYGIAYTLDSDTVNLDFDNAKRYIRGDWREFIEGENTHTSKSFEVEVEYNKQKALEISKEFEVTSKSLEETKVACSDLQSNYSVLETEVNELREYKSNIEIAQYEKEVDEVLEKYSELTTIDGYEELVKDKYSIKLEDLEIKLKVFAFDNSVILGKSEKQKKSFSKEQTIKIPINKVEKEISIDPYNGILDKYIK